jgi:hypothetical protein
MLANYLQKQNYEILDYWDILGLLNYFIILSFSSVATRVTPWQISDPWVKILSQLATWRPPILTL